MLRKYTVQITPSRKFNYKQDIIADSPAAAQVLLDKIIAENTNSECPDPWDRDWFATMIDPNDPGKEIDNDSEYKMKFDTLADYNLWASTASNAELEAYWASLPCVWCSQEPFEDKYIQALWERFEDLWKAHEQSQCRGAGRKTA
jgi:hypothetical protein